MSVVNPPPSLGTPVGAWVALTLSAKLEQRANYEALAARLENFGASVRLRGCAVVVAEVKTSAEMILEVAEAFRPKKKVTFGLNVLESGGETNHTGALMLAPTGVITDDETPVPAGVIYLLDGITYNLT